MIKIMPWLQMAVYNRQLNHDLQPFAFFSLISKSVMFGICGLRCPCKRAILYDFYNKNVAEKHYLLILKKGRELSMKILAQID